MDSRDSNKGTWIFVSHSNRDIEKVREIRNELERRGHNPVLFYLKCMEVTEADDLLLWQLIEPEIQAREWFVLCDSPNARSSPAVLREMELVRSMVNEGKVVEVVHLDGDLQNEIRKVIGLSKRCTVFLSYSHRDSLIAEQIRHSLEQHGFSVWFDRDSLGAGNDWQKSIQSGMDEAIARGFVLLLLSRRSYFYLRDAEAPASAVEFVDPPPLLGKLEQLKDEIRSCGRPVRNYPCRWTGMGFAEMEQFGKQVLDDLWSGILRDSRYVSMDVWRQALGTDPDTDTLYTDESEPVPRELWEKIVALAKPEPKEPLDAEREQMDAFAESRLRWFQGRTREISLLTSFLDDPATDAPRLAVVAAVPGQGKSALLANGSPASA